MKVLLKNNTAIHSAEKFEEFDGYVVTDLGIRIWLEKDCVWEVVDFDLDTVFCPFVFVKNDNVWGLHPDEARVWCQNYLIPQLVIRVQARLDTFANTRNYGTILSACTYATSTVPKFAAEGQCAVNARDATWAKLYEMLAEVEAGTRPVPTGFANIEPELPVLEWPV